MKKTVLITGAEGVLGSILCQELASEYDIRALSRYPIPARDSIAADINDLGTLVAAFQGVDSIIHLAAEGSTRAPWEKVLHSNISGVYTVYEAAVQAGVKQIILASTNHTVGIYDQEHEPAIYQTGQPTIDHQTPARPDSLYGVSKCFGETLGRFYADTKDLHVICLRIGWVNRTDSFPKHIDATHNFRESPERLAALWLSHRDLVQLIQKSLEADHVIFDIFYGISNNVPHYYDIEHARDVIGYEPQDGANVSEVFA